MEWLSGRMRVTAAFRRRSAGLGRYPRQRGNAKAGVVERPRRCLRGTAYSVFVPISASEVTNDAVFLQAKNRCIAVSEGLLIARYSSYCCHSSMERIQNCLEFQVRTPRIWLRIWPWFLRHVLSESAWRPIRILHGASLPTGSLVDVGNAWTRRLRNAQPQARVDWLYCGRSFLESTRAAAAINADLKVISAGLAVVDANCRVPSYSLTVIGPDPDNVLSRIRGHSSHANWWEFIAENSPFGQGVGVQLHRLQMGDVALMALPASYLMMVAKDLLSLSDSLLSKVRIFAGRVPESLAPRLSALVMPYDERLNGPNSPFRGTSSDFPARAMRHFAEIVFRDKPAGSLEAHRDAVRTALKDWERPTVLDRRRCSDEELIGLIRQNWEAAEGRSSVMLRKSVTTLASPANRLG